MLEALEIIWGANWAPLRQRIAYKSIINLCPRTNRSMEILDPQVRAQVVQVVLSRLGGI
jgi:Protein of unknown function (DUF5674)